MPEGTVDEDGDFERRPGEVGCARGGLVVVAPAAHPCRVESTAEG